MRLDSRYRFVISLVCNPVLDCDIIVIQVFLLRCFDGHCSRRDSFSGGWGECSSCYILGVTAASTAGIVSVDLLVS